MIAAMRALLNEKLPPRYGAFGDRYVWLHEPDAATRVRLGKPDVFIVDRKDLPSATVAKMLPPLIVTLPVIRRQGTRYLKIIDRHSRHIVTVIELLSPSNKDPGEDREAYINKRNDYLASGTNLVEIDLLRSGPRMPVGEPEPPPADYFVFVCPANDLPKAGIWSFSVRDPLPDIPVPLNPGETPIVLALRACLDRAYDEGRYTLEIDYAKPPSPPLAEPDATWAHELLSGRLTS
jgi:hypothetical protein